MRRLLRRATPDLLIAILLLLAPLLLFFPQTVGGRTLLPADNLYQWQPYRELAGEAGVGRPHNPLLSDLVLENLPWKQFAREQIAAGEIPLWQPNILGGTPFLAAGQSSMLYPFSVLFLIMPLPAAFGWFTVLQLWLAGLSMMLLVRVLGVRRPGALVAGLTYQLSATFVASAVFPMILATAAWLPFLLAMVELTIRQQPALGRASSLPWAALGAVGLGMAALAGHVEALYFTLLVMAFYALWRLVAGARAHRGAGAPIWLLRRAGWLLVLVAAGLALGAVQILPAYELAGRSFRAGAASYQEVIGWAYAPRRVLAFLMPNFFGSPARKAVLDAFSGQWQHLANGTSWGLKNAVEGAAYVGLLPLLLALIALTAWARGRLTKPHPAADSAALPHERYIGAEAPGRPYRPIFGTLALLSLGFAFGTPLYALLYYGLPFINQSHAPFRWVWPFALAIAVLAGFGVEALMLPPREHATRPFSGRLARVLGLVSLIGAGLTVLALATSRLLYGSLAGAFERVFMGLAGAPETFPDARTFYSFQAANGLLFALMLALSGAVLLLAGRARRSWWPWLAALVVAADLMAASAGFNPTADPTLLAVEPPSIAWLRAQQSEGDPWRIAVYEQPGADTLNANLAWLAGLEDISGYDSLIPAQYAEYMALITPQGDLPYNRIAPLSSEHPEALDSPLLDLLGVRYVITELTIDRPGYTLAYQDDAVRIYQNTDALPRAFTLPATSTVISTADDPLEGFQAQAAQVDFRTHVVVTIGDSSYDAAPASPAVPADPAPATITAYGAREMWVDAEVDAESWLVDTGSYYPGWRAWVRPQGAGDDAEQEVPVHLVNGNFRGVVLEPGAWTVRIRFSPDSTRFGAFASFLTALALIFAVAVWGWRLVYREDPEAAGIQRVAKNTLTPIVLNLFNKGISFVLTFASLRMLGPARAGDYRFAIAIWMSFDILISFGLHTYLTREVARRREAAGQYLANTTLLRLALAVIGVPVLAGFLLGWQLIVTPPLDDATLWTIGLLYGGLFFSTISTGLTGLFYGFEKAETPAAVQTISAFLTTTLGIGALLAGWGIVGLAGVSLIVNAITLAILGTLAYRAFFHGEDAPSGWRLDRSLLREAMGESFPLMLNQFLSTLFFRIDVVLLRALKGSEVVGWYSVVYTWVDAIMVIPSYFTLSLFPVLSRQAVEDRDALRRAYRLAIKLMTLISVPTAIFTTLLATFLIRIVGGPQYLPHGAIALAIFIWSIVIGWQNSVTQYVLIALGRQRTITGAFVIGAAFNIAANLILIPRYSYPAAAAITIASEGVLWVTFYAVLRQELKALNWVGMLWRIGAAGVLAAAAAFGLGQVSVWAGFGAGLAVYVGALLVLRPFSTDELTRLAPAIPARLRARLLPRIDAAGELQG